MYLIGDKVVHPMHGAGIIEEITEERLGGKTNRYYVFRMPVCGLTLKLPVENCAAIGIRTLYTISQIEEVLGHIPLLEVEMTANWNRRYRENMERIKSGELIKVAQVIKGLMWRDKQRGLSNGERKMLHSAKQILLSEIVLVCDTPYADAEKHLNQTMMIGVNNA
ncbi:MAG: CarD family transcriptional regulator [Eubacteriales bacterium]|nr:CarD family transcriptional regulator [Eubacteriales bacterium]